MEVFELQLRLFLIICVIARSIAFTISPQVHAFYYLWYGNPNFDGTYKHWDHEVLPHWEKRINDQFPIIGSRHNPPLSIHSPYYPARGLYSSSDEDVVTSQFQEMAASGIDIAVLSWWGQKTKSYATDTQGVNTDNIIPVILKAAKASSIKVAFHLEPYPSRTAESVREDVTYIIDQYGSHPSFYRTPQGKPIFYVYDSYHIHFAHWIQVLLPDGDLTIRGTKYDSLFIGLWLHPNDGNDLKTGGFDGAYTYFAANDFSYGSTQSNWKIMSRFCRKNNLLLSLSVGPGYNDTGIRPWNYINTHSRNNGNYYKSMWKNALQAKPNFISITSYNEWGEGTQIEPAQHFPDQSSKSYMDYGTNEHGKHWDNLYMELTKQFSDEFHNVNSEVKDL